MDDKLLTIFNIGFVFVLMIICAGVLVFNNRDREKINEYYEEIKENNDEIMQYLQTINAFPSWRISFSFGILSIVIIGLFMALVFNSSGLSKASLFWILFWFIFVINTIIIYKFAGYWNFHYMCANGCVSNDIYNN